MPSPSSSEVWSHPVAMAWCRDRGLHDRDGHGCTFADRCIMDRVRNADDLILEWVRRGGCIWDGRQGHIHDELSKIIRSADDPHPRVQVTRMICHIFRQSFLHRVSATSAETLSTLARQVRMLHPDPSCHPDDADPMLIRACQHPDGKALIARCVSTAQWKDAVVTDLPYVMLQVDDHETLMAWMDMDRSRQRAHRIGRTLAVDAITCHASDCAKLLFARDGVPMDPDVIRGMHHACDMEMVALWITHGGCIWDMASDDAIAYVDEILSPPDTASRKRFTQAWFGQPCIDVTRCILDLVHQRPVDVPCLMHAIRDDRASRLAQQMVPHIRDPLHLATWLQAMTSNAAPASSTHMPTA